MTGEELAKLMVNDAMKAALAKHARRYSKRVEDQEEYIQDAWLRISGLHDDKTFEYYEEQGRLAIKASYYREWRAGHKPIVHDNNKANVYGYSEGHSKKPPHDSIQIDHNKYLKRKPERLSAWYYSGEWDEYGYAKEEVARSEWFQIIIIDEAK